MTSVMDRRTFIGTVAGGLLAAPLVAEGQPAAKVYRIGVVLEGGPYSSVIDGLRAGLKELGFEEGRQYILHIRDLKGDRTAVAETARTLEAERVDVIVAVSSSTALAAQRATVNVPIVFYAGGDPVAAGLVKSLAQPGDRLTGVHSLTTDLLPKRLEYLKEILPRLRRVLTFYDSGNENARNAAMLAREAATRLRFEVVERQVHSVDELRAALLGLKAGDVDAFFPGADAMVISQGKFIAETAKAKKLPTMFPERTMVVYGGLASYGPSFYTAGRLAAKHVQRVLSGTSAAELPVERLDRFELVLNARTARQIGLMIPQSVLLRADEVIQ